MTDLRRAQLETQARETPGQLVEDFLALETRLAEREELIAQQQSEIQQLRRQLFGPKSEKLTPEQQADLANVVQDLQEQQQRPGADSLEILQAEEKEEKKSKTRRRRRRHPMPAHLKTITIQVEPEACGHCGKLGVKIGEEVTQEVDLIPAQLIVRRTVRIKRLCQCGCGGIAIAPLPARILPGSKLGVGLAAFILLSKYDDHLALHTLERIFRERHGVVIPRQQMVQWIERIAGMLRLLTDRIWQRMKQGRYLQIDETPVKVLDPEVKGKAATGYLWFFGVPGGDVFLEFSESRAHEVPARLLEGFSGAFQSDGFEGYETLQKKRPNQLKRLGCAAHARRKFYVAALEGDEQAVWFIRQFRQLYRLEDQVRTCSGEARQEQRQSIAPAIWAEMKVKADELEPKVLPKSSLGKALSYFRNEFEALQGYLEDPAYQIDNNLIENAIRPSCVGKKRWLFIGHPQAGWRSAVIYTIIQSCRRRGINPQDYLTDVLTRMPGMKSTELDSLLPENWKPTGSSP